MLSTTARRALATALTGVAIAGTTGASAASAMPIDPLQAPGEASDMPIANIPARNNAIECFERLPDVIDLLRVI